MTDLAYKYTCINCGGRVSELYKKYSATVLKLVTCGNCQNVADKYIEYDPVIIMIDLILLRKEAYRHFLFNAEFENHWKLAVLLQIMESYSEWILGSPYKNDIGNKSYSIHTEGFNAGDLEFYKICSRSIFRSACFITIIFLLTLIYNKTVNSCENTKASLFRVWKAITLSSFGTFLLLPSLIWDDNAVQEYHLSLVSFYTTLSQLVAYTVVCNCSKKYAIVVITISYISKVFSADLYNVTYKFSVDYCRRLFEKLYVYFVNYITTCIGL